MAEKQLGKGVRALIGGISGLFASIFCNFLLRKYGEQDYYWFLILTGLSAAGMMVCIEAVVKRFFYKNK